MGKGDKRTKRGKLFRGSRGKATPRRSGTAAKADPKAAPKPARQPRTPTPAEPPPPAAE